MSTNDNRLAAPCMPSDDEVNKRGYRRLPRPYPVEVRKLSFPMTGRSVETVCCDISKGGICVEAPLHSLSAGDKCQVRVLIPLLNKFSPGFLKVYENDAEQYLLALAEVAWVKPVRGRFLAGLRFENVDSDQSKALERLVERAFAKI